MQCCGCIIDFSIRWWGILRSFSRLSIILKYFSENSTARIELEIPKHDYYRSINCINCRLKQIFSRQNLSVHLAIWIAETVALDKIPIFNKCIVVAVSEIVENDATKVEEDNSQSGTQTGSRTTALQISPERVFLSITTSAATTDLTSRTSEIGIRFNHVWQKLELKIKNLHTSLLFFLFFKINLSYWIVLPELKKHLFCTFNHTECVRFSKPPNG